MSDRVDLPFSSDVIGLADTPAVDPERDEVEHTKPVEWWYYVGQVKTREKPGKPSREFGFEFTVVRIGPGFGPHALGYYAYTAMSNIEDEVYRSAELLDSSDVYKNTDVGIKFEFANPSLLLLESWVLNTLRATEKPRYRIQTQYMIQDQKGQYSMDLKLDATKPAFLQGDQGIVEFGGIELAYYTRPRFNVEGDFKFDGVYYQVEEGTAWMDHQWGDVRLGDRKWKFFGIHLDDGRDVCLIDVVKSDGTPLNRYATLVEADGAVQALDPDLVEISPQGDTWATWGYPLDHLLKFPEVGLVLRVIAAFEDQRRVVTDSVVTIPELTFWEGACIVRDAAGDRIGSAYLELGGYEQS